MDNNQMSKEIKIWYIYTISRGLVWPINRFIDFKNHKENVIREMCSYFRILSNVDDVNLTKEQMIKMLLIIAN